ncbi:MAG: hypothetical protein ACPW60_15280 [Methylohalobius sp. ZOD2]
MTALKIGLPLMMIWLGNPHVAFAGGQDPLALEKRNSRIFLHETAGHWPQPIQPIRMVFPGSVNISASPRFASMPPCPHCPPGCASHHGVCNPACSVAVPISAWEMVPPPLTFSRMRGANHSALEITLPPPHKPPRILA